MSLLHQIGWRLSPLYFFGKTVVEALPGRGLEVGGLTPFSDCSHVSCGVDHTKRLAENQIPDNIKGDVVEPGKNVEECSAIFLSEVVRAKIRSGTLWSTDDFVQLKEELGHGGSDVGFKVLDVLWRKYVRYNLALTGVFSTIPSVEEALHCGDRSMS